MPGIAFVLASIPLWIGAIIAAFVTRIGWRRAAVPGSRFFTLALAAVFVWSLTCAISVSATSAGTDVLFAKLSYIGIVLAPVGWMLFAAQYTGIWQPLFHRGRWLVLLIIPAITLVMALVPAFNDVMWVNYQGTPEAGTAAHGDRYGAWFAIHTFYSYTLIIIGALVMGRMALRSRHVYRKQAVLTIIALAIPFFGNVAFVFGVLPGSAPDLTPFFLAVSTLVLAVGLLRFRLLDVFAGIVPVARDAAIEGMVDGVLALDLMGRVADVNPAGRAILGLSNVDLVGRPATGLLIGDVDLGPLAVRTQRGGSGSVQGERVEAVVGEGERRRYYDLIASDIGGDNGRIIVIRDVTEQRRAQEALGESEHRYRALFERATDFVFTLRPDGTLEAVNHAIVAALGYTADELTKMRLLEIVDREHADIWAERFTAPVTLVDEGVLTLPVRAKDGRLVQIEASLHAVVRGDEIVAVQGIARDVTDRNLYEAVLRHQALHDGLTELPNRVLLFERMESALTDRRNQATAHALMLIDLDRFKEINDTHGHHVGDVVLRDVSARFRIAVRESDTIARLGGDEFVSFMPHASADDALEVAGRFHAVLRDPVIVEGLRLEVHASIGIAAYPEHGGDVHELMRAADAAMYIAKRSGSGLAVYAPADDLEAAADA